MIDPQTGLPPDLIRYYGAWVTPHIEPIQALLRRAAELVPEHQIWGYQGTPDVVPHQVEALYNALKEAGITYVNSIIDFGAGPGLLTQRTRLPRESLKYHNANCIDGTVLFASLLESASLHAGIVLVPGHAFVAWEKRPGSDEWDYLETTTIGTHDFAAANACGQLSRQRLHGVALIAGFVQNQKIIRCRFRRSFGVGSVFVVNRTDTKSFAGIDGCRNSRNLYLNETAPRWERQRPRSSPVDLSNSRQPHHLLPPP